MFGVELDFFRERMASADRAKVGSGGWYFRRIPRVIGSIAGLRWAANEYDPCEYSKNRHDPELQHMASEITNPVALLRFIG